MPQDKETKNSEYCQLCHQRRNLTFHHTIPRKLHRRKRYRRNFSREHLGQGIHICGLCHSGLHSLYDETTLAERFHSIVAMLDDPAIFRHVQWSARQKQGKFSN